MKKEKQIPEQNVNRLQGVVNRVRKDNPEYLDMIFHLGVKVEKEPARFGAPQDVGETCQVEEQHIRGSESCLGLGERGGPASRVPTGDRCGRGPAASRGHLCSPPTSPKAKPKALFSRLPGAADSCWWFRVARSGGLECGPPPWVGGAFHRQDLIYSHGDPRGSERRLRWLSPTLHLRRVCFALHPQISKRGRPARPGSNAMQGLQPARTGWDELLGASPSAFPKPCLCIPGSETCLYCLSFQLVFHPQTKSLKTRPFGQAENSQGRKRRGKVAGGPFSGSLRPSNWNKLPGVGGAGTY